MNDDGASKDELNRASSLRLGIDLALVFRNTDIIPEMKVATLHVDKLAEPFKVVLKILTVELRRVAAMKIKDQFFSVALVTDRCPVRHDRSVYVLILNT